MKAILNSTIVAESDQTILVEGNHYFPPDSLKKEYFQKSNRTSTRPWKGEASYYDVVVGDERAKDAGWYYPKPKPEASHIAGYVAFWNGIDVQK